MRSRDGRRPIMVYTTITSEATPTVKTKHLKHNAHPTWVVLVGMGGRGGEGRAKPISVCYYKGHSPILCFIIKVKNNLMYEQKTMGHSILVLETLNCLEQ